MKLLNKQHAKEILNAGQTTQDLRIRAMKDGYDKEIAMLRAAKDKELKDVKAGSEDYNNIVAYYQKQEIKLRENHQKEVRDINRKIEDLALETMTGATPGILAISAVVTASMTNIFNDYNKDLAKLRTEHKRALEDIAADEKLNAEQRAEMVILTNEKYRQNEENLKKDFDKKVKKDDNDRMQTNIENRLAIVQKGSQEEYDLRIQLLELQRLAEVAEAETTGADVKAINDKYDNLKTEALQTRISAELQIELNAMTDRISKMQEIQDAEEQTILERLKQGEITREEYDRLIEESRKRHSRSALEFEIANLEKLLKTQGLSAEEIAELRKQLADNDSPLVQINAYILHGFVLFYRCNYFGLKLLKICLKIGCFFVLRYRIEVAYHCVEVGENLRVFRHFYERGYGGRFGQWQGKKKICK